uniref:uncharacterized protein LOC122578357 n=1 Tax=Erigeron canadensis TaxID=72917 RepID=UPI001CB9B38B|nr:uncharacterized protein LOC122578357 [Erigeron canadensis]
MNMTTMIKASVYTPKVSFLLYNRPSLMNVSVQVIYLVKIYSFCICLYLSSLCLVQIPSRLQQDTVGPLRLSSAVLPILNKQHVATCASFQCRYAKDKTTAQTEPGDDSRLWIHALKWLTRSCFWISYFCLIWMLPKYFIITSLVLLLTVTIVRVSKKTEPDNVTFDDLVGVEGPKDMLRKLVRVHQGKVKSRDCERQEYFSRSIIYIKDVDVLASHKRILVKLHREMEKCSEDGKVMVIVSTNKPETQHPAFMRLPYLKVHVGKPNTDSRRTIIGLHLRECLREEDKEAICNLVASETPGFVWADLEKATKKAMRLANARGDNHVTMELVLQAVGVVKPYICCDENEATVQA